MGSLIGKALTLRNASPPVPMTSRSVMTASALMGAPGGDDEACMRAFGTQGTVQSNVSLLASSTAKPPWKLYRKQPVDGRTRYTTNDQGSDQRTEVIKHQSLNVLNAPALPFFTRFSLFELSQIWLDCTGKSHWVVGYDDRASFPVSLWPVRPDRMTPVPDRRNFLAGWVYTAPDGREQIPLKVSDVIFNRYPDPLDPTGGVGPVASVLTDIDAARYGAEWNRNFFVNSAVPGGVIQIDGHMEDDEYNTFVDRWREAHRGVSRAHRVAMLEGGATWVPNSMTVRDMDFSNLRSTGADIIREALGMHKVMTGVTEDVNRANAQTGEEVFASWKIVPRLDRWKDVLNYQFLPLFYPPGADIPVEYDYSFPMPLNREQDNAELVAKAQALQMLVDSGFDPEAACEVVGLPVMPVVEKATQSPALPPGWVPGMPPAAPGAPDAGEQAAEPAGGGDDPAAAVERLLADVRGRELAAWNFAGSRR